MNKQRKQAILDLIRRESIETQEELQQRLRVLGYDVTQATISRDIKNMRLIKVQGANGRYSYAAQSISGDISLFEAAAKSADYALNNVVIRCQAGTAAAAAAAFDRMETPGVLGSIAGDDTIIVITKTEADARALVERLGF